VPASQPTPLPPPSSRPGAGSCRGSSLSRVCAERSGGTRPPGAPLTGGFRGGRIARRGEDGPAARAGAVSRGASRRGPADGGCGGTALRRRPAPCVPNAKAAGRRPPAARLPPAEPSAAGHSTVQRGPSVTLRSCPELAQGRPARRAEGVPLEPSRKAASLGRAQRRATLRHMAHRAPGARRRGPPRGTCEEHGCPTPTDRGHRQPKTRGTAEGLPAWLSSGRPSGGRCRLRRRPCLSCNLGAGC
jgi:hypothetical protein